MQKATLLQVHQSQCRHLEDFSIDEVKKRLLPYENRKNNHRQIDIDFSSALLLLTREYSAQKFSLIAVESLRAVVRKV